MTIQNNRLNGINPLSYLGVNATQPPQIVTANTAPTTHTKQYPIGTIWIEGSGAGATAYIHMGVNSTNGNALWPLFTSSSSGDVLTLSDDANTTVNPNGSGNIQIQGDAASGITVTATPGSHLLTVANANRSDISAQTTDDTPTAIETYAIPNNSSIIVNATVLGSKEDFSNSAGLIITRTFRRAGGAATECGATVQQVLCSDAPGGVTADLLLIGSSAALVVTGEADTTYNWEATFEFITIPA